MRKNGCQLPPPTRVGGGAPLEALAKAEDMSVEADIGELDSGIGDVPQAIVHRPCAGLVVELYTCTYME